MAEWSNAAVLKTVVPHGTGGSNPSSSAGKIREKQQNPVNQSNLQGFLFSLHADISHKMHNTGG